MMIGPPARQCESLKNENIDRLSSTEWSTMRPQSNHTIDSPTDRQTIPINDHDLGWYFRKCYKIVTDRRIDRPTNQRTDGQGLLQRCGGASKSEWLILGNLSPSVLRAIHDWFSSRLFFFYLLSNGKKLLFPDQRFTDQRCSVRDTAKLASQFLFESLFEIPCILYESWAISLKSVGAVQLS